MLSNNTLGLSGGGGSRNSSLNNYYLCVCHCVTIHGPNSFWCVLTILKVPWRERAQKHQHHQQLKKRMAIGRKVFLRDLFQMHIMRQGPKDIQADTYVTGGRDLDKDCFLQSVEASGPICHLSPSFPCVVSPPHPTLPWSPPTSRGGGVQHIGQSANPSVW